MSAFGFLTAWMGTQSTAKGVPALNLVALKDAQKGVRDKCGSGDKKRSRRFSEERALSKANAIAFFQDAAFGGDSEEIEEEKVESRSRKSLKLDDKENTDSCKSSSPSPTKSAKKRNNKKIDATNKHLVKNKRRLRNKN